ncbi:MAG TPA: NUDIX domain-containing protein [Candidatus Nanoarchaeia archaeon]|nr:NUDIX domain-containing protein [Candidatus Nanoarchaeia archaeon]
MNKSKLAVKAFIVDKNKLLVLKRSSKDNQKPSIWELPGGRLEDNEDPHQGIKREVKEETNLDIEILAPLSIRHFKRDDGEIITMIIFICKKKEGEIKLSYEHSAYEFIELSKSKDKLASFFHQEVDLFNKIDYSKLLSLS